MAIARYGKKYLLKLLARREEQLPLLVHSLECGQQVIDQGGTFVFEWPDGNDGWRIPILQSFIERNGLHTTFCAGCSFGMTDDHGTPMRKR